MRPRRIRLRVDSRRSLERSDMIALMESVLGIPKERSDELIGRIVEIVRGSCSTEECARRSAALVAELKDEKEAFLAGLILGYITDAVLLYDDPASNFAAMYEVGEAIRESDVEYLRGDVAYV